MQACEAMIDDSLNPTGTRGLSAVRRHGVPGPAAGSRMDVVWTLAIAAAGFVTVAVLLALLLGLTAGFVGAAISLIALTALSLYHITAHYLPPAAFGPANRITTVRAVGTAMLLAFVGQSPTAALTWTVVVVAIALLVLDGLDGFLARRSGLASAFGARYDMETDAALTLVLALLCWQFGKAGAWILAVGLMRYLFVAAGAAFPFMRRALPPSRRRQTICVLQLSGLLAVLSPLFPVPASFVVGALTLILLAVSFGIDTAWLVRMRAGR